MLILKNIRVREILLSIMQDVRKLSCKHILQWKFRDSGELIAVMVKTDRAPFYMGRSILVRPPWAGSNGWKSRVRVGNDEAHS